jgi:hypothetical protein
MLEGVYKLLKLIKFLVKRRNFEAKLPGMPRKGAKNVCKTDDYLRFLATSDTSPWVIR